MNVTQEELKDVLETSEELVVVDFWASWCGPCKLMSSVFKKLDEDNPNVPMYKVEVDKNEGVGKVYGIKSIPAFIFFKNGVEVDRLMGRQSKKVLQEKVDEHV